ncbi:MAG: PAS domain S-box protein [Desulfamplus sp.]|nr:PAS domain S-box protein [Desulfamplus sp.]
MPTTYSNIQKILNQTLNSPEYLYSIFAENIDDVIYISDKSYELQYVSPSIEKLLGYTQQEFLSKKMGRFILFPRLEEFIELLKRIKEDDKEQENGDSNVKKLECKYLHKDGKQLWVEIVTIPIRNKKGKFNGFIGIFRNINDRKAMELSLKESNYRLELALQASSIGLWDADIKYNKIFFNKRCAEIIGYDSEITLSPSTMPFDFIVDEDKSEIINLWKKQLKNSAAKSEYKNMLNSEDIDSYINMECRIKNRNDQLLWIMVMGKIVEKFDSGKISRAIGTCLDITDRKSFEQLLKQKNDDLEYNIKKLQQTNDALNILIEHRDLERVKFCESIFNNFQKLVFPFLRKIQETKNISEMDIYIKILEQNIHKSLIFLNKEIPLKYNNLTNTEIKIVELIKEGINSKEIAQMLNISERSVFFHRANIRKKFNLHKSKINLRRHLKSI